MQAEPLGLDGLVLITPRRHADARGWFSESWNAARMAEAGLVFDFLQDNHAYSRDAGVIRGLHYQSPPAMQTKLVRCVRGRIWDVAVDVRRGSADYGQWRGVELSPETGAQLLVPRGYLHGYLTLEPDTEVEYKVDGPYSREHDGAVRWNDPDLAIAWPLARLDCEPVLSDKDLTAPLFRDFKTPFSIGALS